MAERGRRQERSDVYRDYSQSGDHASYNSRGRNQEPTNMDKRGSAGDRRAKQNRQRDMTTASDVEPPAYRDHNHEGPSRL